MERQFISDVTFDLPTYQELTDHMRPRWARILLRVLTAVVIAWSIWYALTRPAQMKYVFGGALILIGLMTLRRKDGGTKYRKILEENGGQPRRKMISITDAGIHCWDAETKATFDVAFTDVRAITRTRRFLVLKLADGVDHLISHSNVTGGTPQELEDFLKEKCGIAKVRAPRDDSLLRKIILWTTVIGFCWSFFAPSGGYYGGTEYMELRECAELLEDVGIEGIDESLLTELEAYGYDNWTASELLFLAGMGEYDTETWEWTPSKANVYSFDLEIFELSAMYTNFLRGVESMSGGALVFSDITEDDSDVNWEAGTGTKTVTFTFEGQQYTLRPEMMNDWFDPEFANDLADIVGTGEDGRRLYFLYDGFQTVSVFYCDPNWARHFSSATGYSLSEKLF